MRKYFDLSSWFILFALLPFSVLALLSQNSVPGDFFYPVKRGLENMILVASSVHPSTRVAFRTDLTERRFREAEQLLVAKADVRGLDEFIEEIQITQNEVSTFSDPVKRVEFTEKLLEQIESYETKLAQAQIQVSSRGGPASGGQNQPIQAPQPGPFEQLPQQPLLQTPTPTQAAPRLPSPGGIAPGGQATPQPVQTPAPQPIIPFVPVATSPPISEIKKEIVKSEIENTKKELEKIKEKLSREAGSRPAGKEEKERRHEENNPRQGQSEERKNESSNQ